MAKMTFEAAMKRLDEIVALLEQGEAPLENSLKLFEEGTKLAQFCDETLKNAQLRIEELSEEPGEPDTEGTEA